MENNIGENNKKSNSSENIVNNTNKANKKLSFGKKLLIVVLGLIVLIGTLLTVCGGLLTIELVTKPKSSDRFHNSINEMGPYSLLIGILLFILGFFSIKYIRKYKKIHLSTILILAFMIIWFILFYYF